jgi:CRP-like cAMP-binding protein
MYSSWQQLQEQLNLADQWIVALGSGSARQRVARLILIFEEFFADKNGAFLLISREDMAAMIGIAIETVSRMIAEFKREDLLQKAGGKLYLCKTEELKAIAHKD